MLLAGKIDNDRVVRLPVKSDPTISFRIVFNAGTQYDPAGKEGLAYLTAEMLSEGATKENDYDVILKKLFPLAASFSVSGGREISVFTGRVHKDNLKEYYKLFAEQILDPAFKEDDFNRIKENVLNYLTTTLKYSSDEELGKATLYSAIYSGTSYAHPDEGTISGVKSITLDDVKEFYRTHYNKNNFVLGIGGGYDKALIQKLWNDLEKLPEGSRQSAPVINEQKITGQHCVIVEKKAASTAISLGYPIDVVRGSADWYALAVANSWLGEHRNSSSHLYQVIREERGLNYGDYSYIENYPNGGRLQLPPVNVPRRKHIFEIWIRPVLNENAHFALRAAIMELKKLVDNGMTQEDFNLTRGFLRKYILHYAPTTSKRLGYALDDKFYGLEKPHLDLYKNALDKVTLEAVNRVIKRYLQANNMMIAIVTQNAETLKKNLVQNTASPISYSTPKDENILKEDKLISTFPLDIKNENVKILSLDELFK
jgi:zinc protease